MLADVVVSVLLLSGCALFIVAAVGAVRFPDVLTRMHPTTKAATVGLVLVLAAAAVGVDDPAARTLLALVAVFQFITAPVAAHMIGRAAYRAGACDLQGLETDALARDAEAQETAVPPAAERAAAD